jgi:hypothetical protein
MPDNLKVLELIQISSTAMEKAESELSEKRAADVKVAALIPSVVEALIRNERIDPADREKAAEALKDPARVLEILIKCADLNMTIRPRTLGTAVTEKKASTNTGRNDNYVGRRDGQPRESDRVFLQGLGITPQS